MHLEAGDDAEITHDGLYAVANSILDRTYVRPDFDFSVYDRIFIETLQISAQYASSNANRDHGYGDRADFTLHQTDLDRLVRVYREQMKAGFGRGPGRTIRVVTTPGDGTLRLSSILINFILSAPNEQSRDVHQVKTYTGSTSRITVMAEVRDPVSGDVLVRFADTKSAIGNFQVNQQGLAIQDAEWVFKVWANTFRRRLEVLRKQGTVEAT